MHAIFGERFVGARTPAWHQLGTVVQDDMSVEDAIRLGEIDFEYLKVAVGYELPNGRFVESKDQFAIVREPVADDMEYRELGIVGKDYHFLQNIELAQGLDKLSRETGWKFETVGALDYGRTVFMTLKIGEQDVKGDKFDSYVIVSDGKVANRALSIAIAPVRVVCQNTLNFSDGRASFKVKLNHSKMIREQYDFWTDNLKDVEKVQAETFTSLDQMASVKISEETAMGIIEAAYPSPKLSGTTAKLIDRSQQEGAQISAAQEEQIEKETRVLEANTERVNARREAALGLYREFNAGNEYGLRKGRAEMSKKTLLEIRETPYAVLQAVSELVDWGGTRNAVSASQSLLFGDGAAVKQRTFVEALKVARA